MKKIAIAFSIGLALLAAACTPEQEAKWQATVTAIRNGVRVAADTAKATLDEVCGYSPALVLTAQTSASLAAAQGKQWAVTDINNAIAALGAICNTPPSSASSYANLAVRAWNAYKAVQAADAAARAG